MSAAQRQQDEKIGYFKEGEAPVFRPQGSGKPTLVARVQAQLGQSCPVAAAASCWRPSILLRTEVDALRFGLVGHPNV